jgi:hypothetical protein
MARTKGLEPAASAVTEHNFLVFFNTWQNQTARADTGRTAKNKGELQQNYKGYVLNANTGPQRKGRNSRFPFEISPLKPL